MPKIAAFVLAGLLLNCLQVRAGGDDAVKRLLGFEEDEIAKLGAKVQPTSQPDTFDATFGTYRQIGVISAGQATEGRCALLREVFDQYNSLGPGNKTTYYERLRAGRILLTSGWFSKAFPKDWSGYERLWMDLLSEDGQVRVSVQLEDADLPEPVVRTFALPAGKWVTLELDLAEASRQVHLDLTNLRCLDVLVIERIDAPRTCRVRLDNVRLAKATAQATLPVLRDPTPVALQPRPVGERVTLGPMDVAKSAPGDGRGGTIELPRPNSYALMAGTERAIGGFGDGGIVLAVGRRLYVSLDRGGHWTGLDGKPEPTILSRDYRGDHRATALVLGTDVFAAYTTDRCAGGAGRTAAKFVSVRRENGCWTVGPEVVLDTSARHCHERFSLARSSDGPLWCAWNHTGTDPSISSSREWRARWSPDGGRTWLDAGGDGSVAPIAMDGGPYLAAFRDSVACVWGAARNVSLAQPRACRARVLSVDADRVRLAAESKVPLRRGAEALLTSVAPGQPETRTVLTLIEVRGDQAVAVPAPGHTAAGVRAGQQATLMTWEAPKVIAAGSPKSIASIAGGDLFIATQADKNKSRVWRYDSNAVEMTPSGFDCRSPLLVSAGKSIVMFWIEDAKLVKKAVYSAGQWGAPETVLEQENIETLIAPPTAAKFIPIAVALKDRRTLKVVTAALP